LAEGFDGFVEYKLPVGVEIASDFGAFPTNFVKPSWENLISVSIPNDSLSFQAHAAHKTKKVLFPVIFGHGGRVLFILAFASGSEEVSNRSGHYGGKGSSKISNQPRWLCVAWHILLFVF
jgi:hypothetical protein